MDLRTSRIDKVARRRIELLRLKFGGSDWTEAFEVELDALNKEMIELCPRVTPGMQATLDEINLGLRNKKDRKPRG
jgi:hypothetical protein